MAFPEDVIKQAWERSGGQCECMKRTHRHFYTPCGRSLKREKRGELGEGSWEARHLNSLDGDAVSNCEILCMECHGAL
jgi:5-methylcytosine-specific restriction endonuclease McrA